MITVKEVFEKAFGPLPEGVTGCFIGDDPGCSGDPGIEFMPTVSVDDWTMVRVDQWGCKTAPAGWVRGWGANAGPDISDRSASAFVGFFGDEFDRIAQEFANA